MGKGKGKGKKKQTTTGQASKPTAKATQKPEDTLDNDLDDLDLEDDNDAVDSEDEVTEVAAEIPETSVKSKQTEKLASVQNDSDLADNPKADDDVVEENGAVANPPVEKKMTRKELKKMKKKVRCL